MEHCKCNIIITANELKIDFDDLQNMLQEKLKENKLKPGD
jgi:hypothetical protein